MMYIDTAKMYGNGKSEEWVGSAIAGRKREDIFSIVL
jgi:aryl-alcohol dehydrogenase-like predicted oxidoreductase